MADNILFKSGLASKLNDITKIAGQLLFAIDGTSGSIYLDKDANTRIKMNLDATKLQNARKINGTAFDGTQDITTASWGSKRTVTISDNDGTNTQANANIDGSANFTLKLPATIKATLTGKASTAGHADTAGSATTAASCTGNAATATKLQTARNINGTSFDGSASITTANWGTARDITIGSTKKSVNGSQNYSWSLNEIGALPGKTISGTTAATAGWYRIAETNSSQGNNLGQFIIQAPLNSYHCTIMLNAGISYAHRPTLQQISFTYYNEPSLTKARIVYNTSYNGTYAYLEVYLNKASATQIDVAYTGKGWKLVSPNTAGSIPSGYTSKVITFVSDSIVSNLSGKATSAGTADSAAKWTTPRKITLSGKVTGSVDIDGSQNVTVTTALANNYAGSSTDGGAANSALKLTTSAGDSNTPVYFKDGVPVAVTSIDVKADKAGILDPGKKINGTLFTGAADITTANWGTARTISISDTAGTTGTSVNGSTNYSLIVPSTMTGFNSITSNKLISTTVSSDTGHIVFPDGGQYITSSSTKTGYLKITLPVSWTNAMMRFYIDIYNYSSNSSFTYVVGGYNYASSSAWHNTYAQSIGAPGKELGNLTVRFGHDGTKCAIYIGESNTSWSYPQIMIRDIFIGFVQDEKNYTTGWNIDFTTTLGTITSTISNPNVAYKLYTPRTINGKEFDGSANITTTTWGTARDLTIGNSTKSVNGSAAVTWTLSDIGAVAKSGDTMTGILTGKITNGSWIYATRNGAFRTSTAASGGAASSAFSMKTTNGSWGIANVTDSDNLYFVFGTDANYNSSNNTVNRYYISTAGYFSGSAEKANKWSNARNFAISNKAGAGTAVSVDGSQSAYTLTIPNTITDFVSIGTKDLTASGTVTAKSFSGPLTGNADTATKWKSPITVKIGNTSKTIQGGETATIEYTHSNIGATISKFAWTGGTTSGPILKLSVNGSTDSSATIPSASTTASGVVTTGNQTFSGDKTFNGNIVANNVNEASLIVNTSLQDHSTPLVQALVINSSGITDTIAEITDKNAPGIGFHIGSSSWGSLIFNKGDFKFINYNATGYMPVYASNFHGNLIGNANTATEFNSSRAIALTGNVTGSATSTGKSGWSIATTIANGAVTNGMLKNSSISIAGNSVSLGGSLAASILVSSLGLSNAMHFIGIARNAITDGSTTNPNVENWDFSTVKPGDVVIDKDNSYEYVWSTAGKWERLGPDGSYKVVQSAIDTNTTFENGSNTSTYISRILQDSNGNIKAYKSTIGNLAIKLNGGTTEGTDLFTYNGSAAKTVNITPDAIGATVIPFIIGTQTAATGTWTGTTTEISTLEDGQTIRYWLPYNGSGNATLNLTLKDGSKTGDIPCYRSGTSRLTTHFGAGNIIVFTYRKNVSIAGSSTTYSGWWVNADYDSNTVSMLRYDNARVIAGTNGIYGYSLIALDNNNRWQSFVKSSSTSTTKSMNTEAKFRLPINILYYGAGNDATNGNYVSNTYQIYSAYPSVDLRYSHNYTTNFAINTPVYLEGTIDSDGYFSISTTCITQTFTSGKYYILLGTSNNGNAFQLALHATHPIYYYDGTKLVNYVKKLYANNLTINGKTYNGTSDVDVGTLGVGYGGTGITTNPSMLINLGSGTAANVFAASPRPGVTGTLGVGNGGTGKTNATDACSSFINALTIGSSTPVDADYYVSQYAGGGTTYTSYHRRPMSALYAYIKGKAEGTWNISISGSCGGNAATATKFNSNRAITLTGAISGTYSSNGDGGWSIPTTYNSIVPTNKGGTGNADGRAPKAEKLVNSSNIDLAVGSASKPVYFSGGIPVECTSIGLNSSSASKWANKMTLKLSGTATTTNPSTVSFDGSEGSNGVSLSMPSQISGLTNLNTMKLVLASTTQEAHITFGREGWNYIKAPAGGSIAFVPNNRAISGAGAVLTISDGEVIPGNNNNTINLGNSSYKWKNVYATTFNGALSGNATTATSLSNNVIIKILGTAGSNNSVTFKTAGEYTYSLPQTITNFTKIESDTFVVNDKVTLQYNSTNECLEFVFA